MPFLNSKAALLAIIYLLALDFGWVYFSGSASYTV